MTGMKGSAKYTNSNCSIKGVPRISQIYVLTAERIHFQLDMRNKASTNPSGRDSSSVMKNNLSVVAAPANKGGNMAIRVFMSEDGFYSAKAPYRARPGSSFVLCAGGCLCTGRESDWWWLIAVMVSSKAAQRVTICNNQTAFRLFDRACFLCLPEMWKMARSGILRGKWRFFWRFRAREKAPFGYFF